MKEALEYYNNFDKKLIQDYKDGNKRMEAAIGKLGGFIPMNTDKILDIGCGIGWSTHEFAKAFPNSELLGVDLSPVLITTAKKLFLAENLKFENRDVTKDLPEDLFKVIVMIDVYEHIPKENRNAFNFSLKKILEPEGKIIMACPTKLHQDWLRQNKPEGLQPVDEDIDFEVISNLSQDVNAEVTFFEYQNIWKQNDYFYAVLTKDPKYGRKEAFKEINLELKNERLIRLKNNLQIEVPQASNKNVIGRILNKFKIKIRST